MQCQQCGYDNPPDEILCLKCGLVLKENLVKEGATQHFDNLGNVPISTRWGTSRLGNERKLLLHVRNAAKPLEVCLTDKLVLGRFDTETGEAPDVDLAEHGARDAGVSRRHAVILLDDETLKIMDLGSANATYLNGQKLIARQARILRDGDELRLGKMTVHVHFA